MVYRPEVPANDRIEVGANVAGVVGQRALTEAVEASLEILSAVRAASKAVP